MYIFNFSFILNEKLKMNDWDECLKIFKNLLTDVEFNTWIMPLKYNKKVSLTSETFF